MGTADDERRKTEYEARLAADRKQTRDMRKARAEQMRQSVDERQADRDKAIAEHRNNNPKFTPEQLAIRQQRLRDVLDRHGIEREPTQEEIEAEAKAIAETVRWLEPPT